MVEGILVQIFGFDFDYFDFLEFSALAKTKKMKAQEFNLEEKVYLM